VAKDESELLGLYPDKSAPSSIGTVNLIAAAVQAADPRYVAWLEANPPVPYILDTTTPALPDAGASEPDDLPSCDEQDADAIDHI
jgi:hypothetical protein